MTHPNRRQVLAAGGGLGLSGVLPLTAKAATAMTDPLSGAALYEHVMAYDRLGEHRTGSPGDLATADWVRAGFKAAGLETKFQDLTFPYFQPQRASLVIKDLDAAGFPMWWPVATSPQGITAPLAAATDADLTGKIALLILPFNRGATIRTPGYAKPLAETAAKKPLAIAAVMEGPTGGIIALNVGPQDGRWSMPVLQLPGRLKESLISKTGQMATLCVTGDQAAKAPAMNVIGRLKRGPKWVVISTPQSGWFHCTGERGPGIAIQRGLTQALKEVRSNHSLCFVTTTGHEFENEGGHAFLEHEAPKPADVKHWFHLGAGIATYQWDFSGPRPVNTGKVSPERYLGGSVELLPLLTKSFKDLPGLSTPFDVAKAPAAGELGIITAAKYPSVAGIFAGHDWHHVPDDGPRMTGPDILEPVARAIFAVVAEALKS